MFPHFTSDRAAVLLIDYQDGTLQLAKTGRPDDIVRNATALAKMALAFDMPLVMTSSMEDHVQGPIPTQLQHAAPDAFRARIKREGIVDAWKDDRFRQAVLDTGRKQLIVGAITTDICLVFPTISAVEDGYDVQAVMDACGSPTDLNETISRERLKAAGVFMTVTNTIIAELVQDWRTPAGKTLSPLINANAPMFTIE